MKIIKKVKSVGLFSLTFVLCFMIFSCKSGSKKVGEKVIEKAIENATGADAKVDLNDGKAVFQSGENKIEVDSKATRWPGEIPGEVPEFKLGKIAAVTTSNADGTNAWTIVYKEVQDGFLEKYEDQLKQNGFETTLFKIGDKGGSITAESKKFNVALMGGEGNVSVSVSIKKPE